LECVLKAYIQDELRQKPKRTHNIYLLIEKTGIRVTDIFGQSFSIPQYLNELIHSKGNWVNMRYRTDDFRDLDENEIKRIFGIMCSMIKKIGGKLT